MFTATARVDWVAVIAAFFAYFALGALWFAALFSKLYKRSLGLSDDTPSSRAAIFFVGPAICTFIVVVTTDVLMKALGVASMADALKLGALIGAGYLVSTTVNTAINPVFKRPLLYSAVSGSYHLVGILTASAILASIH